MNRCYKCKKPEPAARIWKPINILWCLDCYHEQLIEGKEAIKVITKEFKDLPLNINGPLHSMEVEIEWDRIEITAKAIQ